MSQTLWLCMTNAAQLRVKAPNKKVYWHRTNVLHLFGEGLSSIVFSLPTNRQIKNHEQCRIWWGPRSILNRLLSYFSLSIVFSVSEKKNNEQNSGSRQDLLQWGVQPSKRLSPVCIMVAQSRVLLNPQTSWKYSTEGYEWFLQLVTHWGRGVSLSDGWCRKLQRVAVPRQLEGR